MVDDRSLFICPLTCKIYNFYVAPNVLSVLKYLKFSLFLPQIYRAKSSDHLRNLKIRLFCCYSTQIVQFSYKISATGTSSHKIVIERDQKQCADISCEKKTDFSYIIPNVFDRRRVEGFSLID